MNTDKPLPCLIGNAYHVLSNIWNFAATYDLQYFEMSERPWATHPKNQMLQCIISLCKNNWCFELFYLTKYSVFEALTCHSSDNVMGAKGSVPHVVDVDAFMSCTSSGDASSEYSSIVVVSALLSHLAPGRPVLSSWWVLTLSPALLLLLLMMVFKFMLMVILIVVASWISRNIVKRNQLLSNYVLLVFVQFKVFKDLLGPKLFDVMPPAVKIRMQSMLCYLLGILMLYMLIITIHN